MAFLLEALCCLCKDLSSQSMCSGCTDISSGMPVTALCMHAWCCIIPEVLAFLWLCLGSVCRQITSMECYACMQGEVERLHHLSPVSLALSHSADYCAVNAPSLSKGKSVVLILQSDMSLVTICCNLTSAEHTMTPMGFIPVHGAQ